jgi:hypothetical protein
LWFGFVWARYHAYGRTGAHLRYAERASRRLARSIFHGMLRYGPGLEKKQGFLFRAVDVALELFALAASVVRTQRARGADVAARGSAREQDSAADAVLERIAFNTRRNVQRSLSAMWHNDDAAKYKFAQDVLAGHFTWLEGGIIPLPYSQQALTPPSMKEILESRAQRRGAAFNSEIRATAAEPELPSAGSESGEQSKIA